MNSGYTSAGYRAAVQDGTSGETGGRRRKLAGYLRAANELRQTYQQSWNSREDPYENTESIPGAFPGNAAAKSGEEEMVIFPSYAKRHIKQKPRAIPGTIQESSGTGRDSRDTIGAGDAEFWKQEWDKYEDDNAIVDVDVRGWIFGPHRGPMTRKQRLFVGIARQMVGIPAPAGRSPTGSTTSSRASSPHGLRQRLEANAAKHEEEAAANEAKLIIQKGESEADVAEKGGYSEKPMDTDSASTYTAKSRSSSPVRSENDKRPLGAPRGRSTFEPYDDPRITPVQKRASWNQPAQMSPAELAIANTNLMDRIKPFLANPMASSTISAFFYNEKESRQKTIETDVSGHFTIRAALDFVPTHVRILASEKLSITEEVKITEPHGISLISDIDDTVKHSAIASGAREIFKNVFIRDLNDLTVDGVEQWYCRLSKLDVMFHYVSNSPWQLFPVITNYFSLAKLPPGSFHLKQYSGMFQGIFEPVAERKKGTLERILRDFPERRFLLVGDSGEADLEVYTDVVLEHPGRILGVFIRDVTTPLKKGFFDSAMGPLSGDKARTTNPSTRPEPEAEDAEDADMRAAIAASLRDFDTKEAAKSAPEVKPKLPARPKKPEEVEEDLIDLNWDDGAPAAKDNKPSRAPERPAKPANLTSPTSTIPPPLAPATKKAPPPRPRKPSTSIVTSPRATPLATPLPTPRPGPPTPSSTSTSTTTTTTTTTPKPPPKPPRPLLPTTLRSSSRTTTTHPHAAAAASASLAAAATRAPIPPAVPVRMPISSYPAAAAQSLASLYASATGGSDGAGPQTPGATLDSTAGGASQQAAGYFGPGAVLTGEVVGKKEELWRRRWARAREVLGARGVMLRSWRVGGDVEGDAVALVERARAELEREGRGRRGAVGGKG